MNKSYYNAAKRCYRTIQPWLIWSLAAAFFFSEYFARVDPSVMVPELMKSFHVGAYVLSGLSAYFYYPYVAMQIPVGTLIDRFGPRRLLAITSLVCGGAALLFSAADAIWIAELSRVLMGFSAAFAFVGTMKLATTWFEPRRLGLLAGLTQGIGMLGAAVGVGLFTYVVQDIGWRDTLGVIGVILVVLSALIFLIVRDKRSGLLSYMVPASSQLRIWDGLMIVFRNKHSWLISIYAGLIYAPTGALAEFWGPSFMHRVYNITPQLSAVAISLIFIGLAVGGPIMGWLSDRIGKRRPVLLGSAICSLVLISVIVYVPHMPLPMLLISLFLYGVSNMGVALSYAVAGELNSKAVAGISIAFTNMASVLFVPLLQRFIGWLLVFHWKGGVVDGNPFYSAADYQSAMFMLPLSLVLAAVVALAVKETNCRRK